MGEGKPKLFQFWNTENAPDDVEILMRTWADDPAFDYHRFTAKKTDTFIAEHFDERTLAAYRMCRVPAMQSDFFRYCVLFVYGGVYVDAGSTYLGGLPAFLEAAERAILLERAPKKILPNGFLFFRSPRDLLLERIIHTMINNIERKISNNVWQVTGPSIASRLYFSGIYGDFFKDINIVDIREARSVFRFEYNLTYKKSNTDWRVILESGETIFTK